MPKPRKNESKKDFVERCMGDAEAVKDFPNTKQRLAFCYSAFKQAKTKNELHLALVHIRLSGATVRYVTFMGRPYAVIPAVLVQSQVLNNNLGATFLPPSAIDDAWAREWNGAPVVIHEHPTMRGVVVSARNPDIINAFGIGTVYNAYVVSTKNDTQLKAEVWLDLERAEDIEELSEIVKHIDEGRAVELSTGFAAVAEELHGVHNGKVYDMVIRPQGADHLAVFTEKTGACSVEDGCGLGINIKEQEALNAKREEGEVMDKKANDMQGDRVTVLNRVMDFLSGGAPAPLATANEGEETVVHSVGDEFRTLVRRLKVAGVSNATIGETVGCHAECVSLIERGQHAEEPTAESLEKLRVFAATQEDVVVNMDLSDDERAQLLADVLRSEYGGPNKYIWIADVYSEDKKVVFGIEEETGSEHKRELFKSSFIVDEETGAVTLGEVQKVIRRIVYEPVTNEEGQLMEEPGKNAVDNGAQVSGKPDEGTVDNSAPEHQEGTTGEGAEVTNDGTVTTEEKTVTVSQAEFEALQEKVAGLEKVAAPVVEEAQRERNELVETLASNESVPFEKAELEGKTTEELKKLAQMSQGTFFGLRGGPREATNEGELRHMPIRPYYAKAEKEGDE